MKLKESIYIESANPWPPEYHGFFCKIKGSIGFIFAERQTVKLLFKGSSSPDTIYCPSEGKKLHLPEKWVLVENEKGQFLFLDSTVAIDMQSMRVMQEFPNSIIEEYNKQLKPNGYYESQIFQFEEYTVAHKGPWGYICTKNGQKVWSFSGHAYLYTDIMCWKKHLYFGTAGYGGYFYVLDLESGAVLTKIKTGGTAEIVRVDNLCYILSNANNSKLLCIDLCDGTLKDELVLPGKASEHSALRMIENHLHTITFVSDKRNGSLKHAVWNCVSV